MSVSFIILKSIYEIAICSGHYLDGSTALDFWYLACQDGFAVVRHEGLNADWYAQVAVKAFSIHKSKEKEYLGSYGM